MTSHYDGFHTVAPQRSSIRQTLPHAIASRYGPRFWLAWIDLTSDQANAQLQIIDCANCAFARQCYALTPNIYPV